MIAVGMRPLSPCPPSVVAVSSVYRLGSATPSTPSTAPHPQVLPILPVYCVTHHPGCSYASWQHGMELLANIWGTDESLEGMRAFLEKRKPDFQKFRLRSKGELDRYLAGLARDENQAPAG